MRSTLARACGCIVFALTLFLGLSDPLDLRSASAQSQSWSELAGSGTGGGISSTPELSASPSVVCAGADEIYVVWEEDVPSLGKEIYVRRLGPSGWIEVGTGSASDGGISGTYSPSTNPKAVMTSLGLVVAWVEKAAGFARILTRYYDGVTWKKLDMSAPDDSLTPAPVPYSSYDSPDLAVNGAGFPMLVWAAFTPGNNAEILFAQLSGSQTWAGLAGSDLLPGITDTPGFSVQPAIAADARGLPVVTWCEDLRDGSGNFEIRLLRWTGSAWAGEGGSASGGGVSGTPGISARPDVAVDGTGRILVSWQEQVSARYAAYLKRYDGVRWNPLGNSATGDGAVGDIVNWPSLGLTRTDEPVIAYSGPTDVFARTWNGSTWVGLGGSDTGGGISNMGGLALSPALARDSAGNVCVAWSGASPLRSCDIYLRRWIDAPIVPPTPTPRPKDHPEGDGSDGSFCSRSTARFASTTLWIAGGILLCLFLLGRLRIVSRRLL